MPFQRASEDFSSQKFLISKFPAPRHSTHTLLPLQRAKKGDFGTVFTMKQRGIQCFVWLQNFCDGLCFPYGMYPFLQVSGSFV